MRPSDRTFTVETFTANDWKPATPFLDTEVSEAAIDSRTKSAPLAAVSVQAESPFLYEYEGGDAFLAPDPLAEAIAELGENLHDSAFDEVTYELVREASSIVERGLASEFGEAEFYDAQRRRIIADHFEPLAREAEEMADRMAAELEGVDEAGLGETEIDEIADRSIRTPSGLQPAFEQFLRKFGKKLKGAAKTGLRLVKKGTKAIGKLGLGAIIKKLGKLVRPLLQKVVTYALGKLPEKYRPLATKIAQKFGFAKPASSQDSATQASSAASSPDSTTQASSAGTDSAAAPDTPAADPSAPADPGTTAGSAEPAAADVGEIQTELDGRITELLVAQSEMEAEATIAASEASASRAADPYGNLDRARARFIERINELEGRADPTPEVEQFLPAILPVIRLGVRLIGRPRVVGILGKLLGRLIAPIVGKEAGPPLGRAIADVGLKVREFSVSVHDCTGS